MKSSDNYIPTAEDEKFMRLAIEKAREGVQKGQAPFGACIVKDSKVLVLENNTVWKDTDITAHAEVVALQAACDKLKTIHLPKYTLYATGEPCPMCFTAAHWARIERIFYANRIEDAKNYGFNELTISALDMRKLGESKVEVVGDFLRDEMLEVFEEWAAREDHRPY